MCHQNVVFIFLNVALKKKHSSYIKVLTIPSRRRQSKKPGFQLSILLFYPVLSIGEVKLPSTKIPVCLKGKQDFFNYVCLIKSLPVNTIFTLDQIKYAHNSHLPSGEEPVFWEKTAFTLLFLLISLFTDKLDWIFLCIFWETGAESLRLSADTCLAPWWIPPPLLRPVWPPFLILPSSSSLGSCAEGWSWGKRWGWAKLGKKKVKRHSVISVMEI